MSKRLGLLLCALLVSATWTAVLADAKSDLHIRTEVDDQHYTIFKLTSDSERPILAKVELDKRCSGVSNDKKPIVRQYGVAPKGTVELARAWEQTTCERRYRVVEARYADE